MSLDKKRLFGQIIRNERNEQNISLRHLANYVGISAQYLSEIEKGKSEPSKYAFEKIEIELDIVFDINEEKTKIFNKFYNDLLSSFISFKKEAVIELFINITLSLA